ncbi:hypothetical protein COHA_008671 [Chlorella ohadii]|uniref:Uncharacterized protein n=1 Tax=Chlorella ohadii TaxID=2649997 RepID=A0AAD5DJF4_9CHLO|nr:hypothetical protein COHA_008671 [Chlorella ohadii]
MVHVGEWELRIVRSGTNNPFPEVQQQSGAGTTYAVAAPGQEFEVQVIQRATPYSYTSPPFAYLVDVHVDGQSVGYNKIFTRPATSTFQGFLKAGDAQGTAYQGFVFSKPQETEAKQAHNLDFQEGKIKAIITPADLMGAAANQRIVGPAATNESIAKLPEGKKFFMAPSLTTGKGGLKMGSGFSQYCYRPIGPPVVVLELRYETAATLMLRGVLKPDNPAHAAILAQFDETAAEGQDDNEAAGPSRRRAAPAAAAVAVKQEGGGGGGARKRQRRQQQEELIDLTKVTNDNDEVLAAKQANQVLECDLTADDEPAWRAVKKEVHQVL